MEITQELLIDELFDYQENQFQVGYNTAIIHLLKKSQTGYVPKLTLRDHFFQMMKSNAVQYPVDITPVEVTEFLQYIIDDKKLDAIRYLKTITGLGLKDTKDIVDKLFEIQSKK